VDTFLTKDELTELTGYTFKKCQCRALGRMGIKFLVNDRLGTPMVLRKEVENQASTKIETEEPDINLEALKEIS